jgi:hypothetical protein
MAKEYAMAKAQKIEILENRGNNMQPFLQEFELFLTVLLDFYKENFVKNATIFCGKKLQKKDQIQAIISSLLQVYKDIKNTYFFAPFSCKNKVHFDVKNNIKNCIKKVLFLLPKTIDFSCQKQVINGCIELLFFL